VTTSPLVDAAREFVRGGGGEFAGRIDLGLQRQRADGGALVCAWPLLGDASAVP